MGSQQEARRLHAVCIPYPAQGHIAPMLKLAKILHHKGFHITFVNTDYNHKRLQNSRGPNSLRGLPDFQFHSIPDGDTYLTNGDLEMPIECIPGMNDIRFRDLPSSARTADAKDDTIDFVLSETERTYAAKAIIFNTFDVLEQEVLRAISFKLIRPLPPIYTIGPLHLLLGQVSGTTLDSIRSNLWIEEPECLEWLDSKEPNSVVYVNFGSVTVMTSNQLNEFAWGLANTNRTFLWIVRPDLVVGDSVILPLEFVTETQERGLVATWCSQEQVLSHPSIGCFLTHSGWNSTLESVSSGVPMICWPFFADQHTNCRYSCKHWGIGMEIDSNVKRKEVESLVRELMEGEKGKEMKMKALDWKKKAEEATAPGGSSYMNIDNMINQLFR
ncbi:hypothetical protein IFM89_008583 [Coptis chinensis]|uniref:Glycosyltransferase n=1 Tax=Coptis chinensis TaxID=261450 RepID=A0A835I1J1_9MAGN|nr:hypothetical protein IFM89_008583 [Coptis chinensis]